MGAASAVTPLGCLVLLAPAADAHRLVLLLVGSESVVALLHEPRIFVSESVELLTCTCASDQKVSLLDGESSLLRHDREQRGSSFRLTPTFHVLDSDAPAEVHQGSPFVLIKLASRVTSSVLPLRPGVLAASVRSLKTASRPSQRGFPGTARAGLHRSSPRLDVVHGLRADADQRGQILDLQPYLATACGDPLPDLFCMFCHEASMTGTIRNTNTCSLPIMSASSGNT